MLLQDAMNILLTNDDGIHAEGINSLYKALSQDHAVYVIAPESEQSACSNAITVRSQLSIKKIAKNRFSVTGFPADCVIIGLSGNLIPDVGLVIAGINHGPNVGDDLVFSGTVAAARTGYIFGKDAIAISINCYKRASQYTDDAAQFLLGFIDEINRGRNGLSAADGDGAPGKSPIRTFFNINYPDLPSEKIKGLVYTHAGRRIYRDSFQKTKLKNNEALVQMGGYIESVFDRGSDATELDNGFITVTPLMVDNTDYSVLNKLLG
jgi:5'-nucleotidase